IWRDVHTVDLVLGDVAVQPLDLGAELFEDTARFLGDGLQLLRLKVPGAGNLAFNHKLGHGVSVSVVTSKGNQCIMPAPKPKTAHEARTALRISGSSRARNSSSPRCAQPQCLREETSPALAHRGRSVLVWGRPW